MRWPEYNEIAISMDGKPVGYGNEKKIIEIENSLIYLLFSYGEM